MKKFLWLSALPILWGCASPSATATKLTSETFEPRPDDYPIDIMPGEPERAYIAIAQVHGRAPAGWGSADDKALIGLMKAKAREMGGDAIIRYEVRFGAPGTVGQGDAGAQGLVVRWK